MHCRSLAVLALLSIAASGCIVPENERPAVGFGTTFATRFVHRGMTLVDRPVLQPKLGIGMNTVHGDRLDVQVEANMDLRNDTGAAWFPDGHAGRFTQIEMLASWQRQFGEVAVRAGFHSYTLPNGTEFINSNAGSERGGTNELFVLASASVLEANPYVSVHYDYDEVDGAYLRGGIAEDIPIADKLTIGLDGSLGYVSKAQALWMYGIREHGLADLRGEIVLKYRYDARTELRAGVHGSAMLDSQLDDWFAALGIDDDPIWFSLGVAWTL